MFTSIATVSISGNLESKLRAIAKARLRRRGDLRERSADFDGISARDRGADARPRPRMHAVSAFPGFRRACRTRCGTRIFDRIERKFDLMHELGAKQLLICSNVSPAALPDRGRIVSDFRELGERAAKRGLRVGYEALAWGRHVRDHREAWSIVREVDHPSDRHDPRQLPFAGAQHPERQPARYRSCRNLHRAAR